MTISTLAAGVIIVAGTVLLKIAEKEDEQKKEEFLNFK